MKAYRLSRARSREGAFDGEGAYREGGRWNSPGTRVIYASATLALATLEVLVHLHSPNALTLYNAFTFRLEDGDVTPATDLPSGWQNYPYGRATQQVGDLWVQQARSLVLAVPSAVVPLELNYLINPQHPAFNLDRVDGPLPHTHDARLTRP